MYPDWPVLWKDCGSLLAGDQFDEPIDQDAALVLVVEGLEERLLDGSLSRTLLHLIHHILLVTENARGGLDDEVLRVPRGSALSDNAVVIVELLADACCNDLARFAVATHLHILVLDGLTSHQHVGLTADFLAEVTQDIDPVSTAGEEHTHDIRLGDVTQREEQDIGGLSVVIDIPGVALFIAEELISRVDGLRLGIDQLAARHVGNGSLTVSQEDRVHDVQLVRFLELRNDLHRSNDGLVKRSTREFPTSVRVEGGSHLVVTRNECAEEHHHLLMLRAIQTRGEQIEERELSVRTRRLVSLRHHLFGGVLGVVVVHRTLPHLLAGDGDVSTGSRVPTARVDTRLERARGERIHLVGDAHAAAELNENHRLLNDSGETLLHRTAPIHEHHQPVVLTLREHGVAAEDVLAVLVVHHANGVKDTRLANGLALGDLRGLAEFELLHQQIDLLLAGVHEVGLLLHRLADDCFVVDVPTVLTRSGIRKPLEILALRFDNLLAVDDHIVEVAVNQLSRRNNILRVLIALNLLLKVVVEVLLRHRSRRNIRLRVLRTNGAGLLLLIVLAVSGLLTLLISLITTVLRVITGAVTLLVATLITTRTILGVASVGVTTRFALLGLIALRLVILTVVAGLVRGTVSVLLLLRLVLVLLLVAVTEQILSDLSSVSEGSRAVDAANELILSGGEVDTNRTNRAQLVVQVDAISQRQRVEIHALDTEEVLVVEFGVRTDEVAAEAGELHLNQSLDARILNDIEVELGRLVRLAASVSRTADLLTGAAPALCGSVQGVRDLVSDEHVIHNLAHVLPLREQQSTVLQIECSSVHLGIDDDLDVLGGENASHDRLRGVRGVRNDVEGLCHNP